MSGTMERLVDTMYRRATGQNITKLLGTIGELPTRQMLGTAGVTAAALGRSSLELVAAGRRNVLQTARLTPSILDLTRPDQLLEYRERAITMHRDVIMSGEPGIAMGIHMFNPWSEAAWAADSYKDHTEAPKPPMALAEDYYITMGERGVTDDFVREEIVERVIQKLPRDILDINDIETMQLVDLHSMTHDLPHGGAT